MNKNLAQLLLIFGSAFLLSQFSFGAIIGSVSTATGGTGRGAIEPVDGVLINPSSVAQLKSQYLSMNYSADQMGITISDNGKESLFPAALAFARSDFNDLKIQDMALVIGYSVMPRLSVGTTISMVEYLNTQTGVEEKFRQTVADVGVSFAMTRDFTMGVVAYKIASSSSEMNPLLQKQKQIGAGVSYTFDSFVRFRFDVETAPENKTDRLVYMGGLETYMNDWIIFRLGYQNNNVLSKNFTTAGIGFSGPQFGIHYAYLTNVANRDEDRHTVDLGIPF